MTATSGERLEATTELDRRLALLPALAGLASAAVLAGGAALVDVGGSGPERLLVWIGVGSVVHAMVLGQIPTHYAGLGLVAVAAALSGLGPVGQAVMVSTLVVSHEVGRFSLDARLPSRFGPGVLGRAAGRTAALLIPALAVVAAATAVDDLEPFPLLVPVGLAAATAPLYLRRLLGVIPTGRRASLVVRLTLAAGVVTVAVGGALLGAQGRFVFAEDRAARAEERPVATAAETEPSPDEPAPTVAPESLLLQQVVTVAITVAMLVVAALFLVALRRPEMAFELDELDLGDEQRSLGLSGPARAELDDGVAAIDERDYARLLDDLLLDIIGEADPARAIRYGYVTIEHRLGALGTRRRPSETEQELLARALPVLDGDRQALAELIDLFEVARFGVEPVTEAMRARAVDTVRRLQRSLPDAGVAGDGDDGAGVDR